MVDKYYTPSIEEFHIGFEYEQEDINEGGSSLSWYKYTIKEGGAYIIDQLITNEDLGLSYRVKYLDKEDIESLGFVETSNNWFTINAPGKLGYWTQVVIDFRWMHRTEPYKDISISGKRGEENDVIFRGIIKNKSELKVLLKQLNIL